MFLGMSVALKKTTSYKKRFKRNGIKAVLLPPHSIGDGVVNKPPIHHPLF